MLVESLGVFVEQIGDVLLWSHDRRRIGAERGQREFDFSGVAAGFERPPIGGDRLLRPYVAPWPVTRFEVKRKNNEPRSARATG